MYQILLVHSNKRFDFFIANKVTVNEYQVEFVFDDGTVRTFQRENIITINVVTL